MLFFISLPTLPTVASVSVNQLNVKSVLRETSFDPQTTGMAASFIGGCGGDARMMGGQLGRQVYAELRFNFLCSSELILKFSLRTYEYQVFFKAV